MLIYGVLNTGIMAFEHAVFTVILILTYLSKKLQEAYVNNGKTLNLFGCYMKWCYKNDVFNSRKVNAFFTVLSVQSGALEELGYLSFTFLSVLLILIQLSFLNVDILKASGLCSSSDVLVGQ